MGGCASKPKEFSESTKETAPVEQPAKVEETVAPAAAVAEETTAPAADDKKEEESIQDEAPLVDLSKPEEEETKAAEAVPVLVLPGEALVVENPKGDTVEVEVAAKEGEVIYVETVEEETKKEEEKEEEEKPKTAPAATSEDKIEEPLVKV